MEECAPLVVGPCEVVPRETDGVMAAVKLRKCRYLEQCGCTVGPAGCCSQHTVEALL